MKRRAGRPVCSTCGERPSESHHPIFIGPENCEQAIGWTWRYTRDFARLHSIEILKPSGKSIIRVSDLVEAIERTAKRKRTGIPLTDEEIAEQMRQELGLVRRKR